MAELGNTEKTINWGGVIKGVAVVAAVVAVGVGIYVATPYIVSAVRGWLGASPSGSFVAAAVQGVSTAWAAVAKEAAVFGTWVSGLWAAAPSTLGISATMANTAAITAASQTGSGLAVAAGVAATAATIPAASHALHNISFVTEHAAHHAAEHSAKSWADRTPSRRAPGQSFASAAPQPKSSAGFASTVAAPAASKIDAESIRKATANLNKELGA